MRLAALAGVLALCLAVPATAAGPTSRIGDLDGDFVNETVRVVDSLDGKTIRVSDPCQSGNGMDVAIAGPQAHFGAMDLINADRRSGDEVLIDLFSGSRLSGREELRLVAWRALSGDPCAKPVTLFRWTGPNNERPPYPGARYAGFSAAVGEVTTNLPGWELVLDEVFATKGRPRTKPDILRQTLFRYIASKQRYVRYLRRVRHLRP